jgi:hypothetical protein
MISAAEGDFVYIRNEGYGTEELYNQREDPLELTNRARAAGFQPVRALPRARRAHQTATGRSPTVKIRRSP